MSAEAGAGLRSDYYNKGTLWDMVCHRLAGLPIGAYTDCLDSPEVIPGKKTEKRLQRLVCTDTKRTGHSLETDLSEERGKKRKITDTLIQLHSTWISTDCLFFKNQQTVRALLSGYLFFFTAPTTLYCVPRFPLIHILYCNIYIC